MRMKKEKHVCISKSKEGRTDIIQRALKGG